MDGFLNKTFILVLAFLAPLQSVLITVFVLVLLDTITGIWAAIKNKEVITSHKLKQAIIKLFIYEVTIIAAFLIENYISGPLLPLAKIVSSFCACTEVLSLMENFDKIADKPIFSKLIKYINAKQFK